MRKIIALMALLLVCASLPAWAEEFGTVPVREGGVKVQGDDEELVLQYQAPPEALWVFYKEKLSSLEEIRYTDRGKLYTIEDMGSRPWRRISITKTEANSTTVTISMLTWKWIIVMLALRFMGVFVVLLVLFLAMTVATSALKRAFKEAPAEATQS